MTTLIVNLVTHLILLAQEAWPGFIGLALAALLVARLLPPRSWSRAAAMLAAVLAAAPVLGLVTLIAEESWSSWRMRTERARITTLLGAPAVLDGIALPAGAEIRWEDPARRRIANVTLRPPGPALGLPDAYFLNRQGEDDWLVGMEGNRVIDGWPCAAPHVSLSGAGRLRACTLAAPLEWKGWELPARTEVSLYLAERILTLVVPGASPLAPPPWGTALGPLPWYLEMNEDGSLAMARYAAERPLRLPEGTLWQDVRWRYGPASEGVGRARIPVAVSGLPPGEERDARRVSLPWRAEAAR